MSSHGLPHRGVLTVAQAACLSLSLLVQPVAVALVIETLHTQPSEVHVWYRLIPGHSINPDPDSDAGIRFCSAAHTQCAVTAVVRCSRHLAHEKVLCRFKSCRRCWPLSSSVSTKYSNLGRSQRGGIRRRSERRIWKPSTGMMIAVTMHRWRLELAAACT